MNQIVGRSSFIHVNNAYGNQMTSFKLRGTLVSKNGQDIKLDIGNNKTLEIKLRSEIKGNVGDTVVVDKREVVQSKLVESAGERLTQAEEGKYSRMLKMMDLPQRSDLMEALKTLDLHGINLTKENLMNFQSLKSQLSQVVEGLDYDTAIQMIESGADPENDSLEKVAQEINETKESEEEGISLRKIWNQIKGLSTEDAEALAEKIYGSKMGKDIIDIIKALHRAGMEITKKNIERVNDIFNKLEGIKGIGDEKLVQTLKEKGEVTLEQLHKIKQGIQRGLIAAEEKVSQYASRVYERLLPREERISQGELARMEEEIKLQLEREGIVPTEKEIALAKEMIRQGVAVTGEHLEAIQRLKGQIDELTSLLNRSKIAQLLSGGKEIETEKITALLESVKALGEMEGISKEMLSSLQQQVKSILSRLAATGKIQDQELLLLVEKGVNFPLSAIEEILPGAEKAPASEAYGYTSKLVGMMNQLRNLDLSTIAYHMQHRLPLTLESLSVPRPVEVVPVTQESLTRLQELGFNGVAGREQEVIRALIGNQLTINRGNVQRMFEIEGKVNTILHQLSNQGVQRAFNQGIRLEKMDVDQLFNYMHQEQGGAVQQLISQLPSLNKWGSGLLAMAMKNGMPVTLQELQQLKQFTQNQNQLGHQLKDLVDLLEKDAYFKGEAQQLKGIVKSISQGLKQGINQQQEFEDQLSKAISQVTAKLSSTEGPQREAIERGISQLNEALELQNKLNQQSIVLQYPHILGEQMKNLQIYVMNEKRGSRKIDPKNMSVLLNMDTNHMGIVNVYVGVTNKQVIMKIGVEKKQYQQVIEEEKGKIQGLMDALGYEVKELTFRVNEDNNVLDLVEMVEEKLRGNRHYIDITI